MSVISFPIPPYSNVPIQTQNFQPSVFAISNISFGVMTTVTTVVNHNYVIGQEIRLTIPSKFGSYQLNERTGFVISIPAPNQVLVSIDSTQTDPFISSPTFILFQSKTLPQIAAIGDVNTGIINANGRSLTGTFIPGSFQNISP